MIKNKNLLFVNRKETIKKAMIKIKKNGTRTVVVVDGKKQLLGTLSEGDIQEALIKNKKIVSNIEGIYNKNPKKINIKNINKKKIRQIFINGQYGILPAVNSSNIVQKVLTWRRLRNTPYGHRSFIILRTMCQKQRSMVYRVSSTLLGRLLIQLNCSIFSILSGQAW